MEPPLVEQTMSQGVCNDEFSPPPPFIYIICWVKSYIEKLSVSIQSFLNLLSFLYTV